MGIYPDGQVQPLVNVMNGGPASRLNVVGVNDAANYAVTITNQTPTVGHLNVGGILLVNSASVAVPALNANSLLVGFIIASSTIEATRFISTVATGTAPLTVNSTTKVANLNADLLDGMDSTDFLTQTLADLRYLQLTGGTISGNLTVQGNTALGDANTDTVTVIGVSTFRNAANTLTQLLVDAGNNRVIVGSGAALGADTTPNLQVIGRLYVAPESANDTAIQVRRSSAASVGWTLGVENSPVNLAFKDDSDTKVFALGDAAHTYQAMVTGAANVTGSLTVGAGISAGASSAFTGGISVVSGGLSVLAGASSFSAAVTIDATFKAQNGSGVTRFETGSTGIAFFNSAQQAKQTIVGSRGGNVALTNLLSAFANYGMVIDGTTA